MYNGVKINGKHSLDDYGLYIKEKNIEPPAVRTQILQIPGRNGDIDLSDILNGDVTYSNRTVEIVLNGKKEEHEWIAFMEQFRNEVHGRIVQLVFDEDPNYYYKGRAYVEGYEKGIEVASFTLSVDAEPFKYDLYSSLEDWLWDTFDLVNGIIRSYMELPVSGEMKIIIYGTRMPVIPRIYASAEMIVSFQGKTYNLSSGQNRIYDIVIREGENILTFSGTGTVNIDYRGGSL